MLAASVIAFFAFYVLAEKFGVLDDDDERLYRASSSYMPVSSSCARKPVMYSFVCVSVPVLILDIFHFTDLWPFGRPDFYAQRRGQCQ